MDMKTMKSNYVIWGQEDVDNAVVLGSVKGVERKWEIRKGVPRAVTFTKDAAFEMDPDLPYNTLLIDSLSNDDMHIVGSPRLKEFLEQLNLEEVEYLHVNIINHKGRSAATYYIIHPINHVDCLKLDECGADWSSIDEETINRVKRLVLDESKINEKRVLFRPKYFYDVVLVRRDLAEAIDGEDFTGIEWIELSDYP